MTFTEQCMTIGLCVLGTYLTRALPFLIFSEKRKTPRYIRYLGDALPAAVFAMLIVYCLKDVEIVNGSHGLPELISIILTTLLHFHWRQMLLSIAGGTVCYMILVRFVFT